MQVLEELANKIRINCRLAKSFEKNDLVVSYCLILSEVEFIKKYNNINKLKNYLIEELNKLENHYAHDDVNEALQIELRKILLMLGDS